MSNIWCVAVCRCFVQPWETRAEVGRESTAVLPAAYGSFCCFSRLQKIWMATSLLSLPSLEIGYGSHDLWPCSTTREPCKRSSCISSLSPLPHWGHQHSFLDFVLCHCVVSDSS